MTGLIAGAITDKAAASAATFTYDGPAIARVGVQAIDGAEGSPAQPSDVREGSTSPPTAAQDAPTTPFAPVNATEAAERTVVMDRNMPGRVVPYAEKNGYDFYGGSPEWIPRGLQRVAP